MAFVGRLKCSTALLRMAVKAHFFPLLSAGHCRRWYRTPLFAAFVPEISDIRRRSGTLVFCTSDLEKIKMTADSRITGTITEGGFEFGDFVSTDNREKIVEISPYIILGYSGICFFGDRHLMKFVSLGQHNPDVTLEELYQLNERTFGGKHATKDSSLSFIFADCRKTSKNILKMSFDETGFNQTLYSRFQAVAIGSGRSKALEHIAPVVDLLGTSEFCEVRDMYHKCCGLNSMVHDPLVGGHLVSVTWDPEKKRWHRESMHMDDLMKDYSQFVRYKTFPYIMTMEQGAKMIANARAELLKGHVPEDLKCFRIVPQDTLKETSHDLHDSTVVPDFATPETEDPNSEKVTEDSDGAKSSAISTAARYADSDAPRLYDNNGSLNVNGRFQRIHGFDRKVYAGMLQEEASAGDHRPDLSRFGNVLNMCIRKRDAPSRYLLGLCQGEQELTSCVGPANAMVGRQIELFKPLQLLENVSYTHETVGARFQNRKKHGKHSYKYQCCYQYEAVTLQVSFGKKKSIAVSDYLGKGYCRETFRVQHNGFGASGDRFLGHHLQSDRRLVDTLV